MPAKPHIEEKKDQIIAICEEYLKSEGFEQNNCKFSDYELKINLSNSRSITVYFKGEKEIKQKPPTVRFGKGTFLSQILTENLTNSLWQIYLPSDLAQESNLSVSQKKGYLSKKWYDSFRDLAQEPYIDIYPFINLLKDDYLQIYKTSLDIPKEKEGDFAFVEKIFLEQINK